MRTVINTARGTAADTLKLIDRDPQSPAENEIRVRVSASGVNPSDVKVRSGAQGPMVADEVIPHNDGAGIVEAIGDAVTRFSIGDRVWLFNVNRSTDGVAQGVNGTASDWVNVPENLAAELPGELGFLEGACLGVPAMTAHRAVFSGGDVDGKLLFVSGGAGSVGLLAVQMASAAGARVVTSVSNDEKAQHARAAGAEHVINYREEDLTEVLLDTYGSHSVDRFVDVDFAAHAEMSTTVLKRNGEIAAYASTSDLTPSLPYYPMMFNNSNIQLVFVYGMPSAAKEQAIKDINRFAEQGKLRPLVGQRFSLENIAEAHDTVEAGGFLGNVVIDL
ncbi:MAG: NADPH:quinone reductase [Gammaproteobacteria bacterium]|nr:NADPH:quinone reductase [Gammaproteobacteria bacterium]